MGAIEEVGFGGCAPPNTVSGGLPRNFFCKILPNISNIGTLHIFKPTIDVLYFNTCIEIETA